MSNMQQMGGDAPSQDKGQQQQQGSTPTPPAKPATPAPTKGKGTFTDWASI